MTRRTLAIAFLLFSARVPLAIAAGPVVEPGVAFVTGDAVDHNGPIPLAYAAETCCSSTSSYLAHLLDAFVPRAGDRIALLRHWIIDCGHTDYETEIHPLTFLATAHTEGDTTVAWAFYNPYHVTQVYSPDISVAGRVDDPTRFTAP